jgi:excisionase family DNA binding protein
MNEWITVKEAANFRRCSERNILDLIKRGKLEAKKEGRRWAVRLNASEVTSEETSAELLKELREDKRRLIEQVETLERELSESRERTDIIILHLTQQNQLLLEDKRPWWKRLKRRRHTDKP